MDGMGKESPRETKPKMGTWKKIEVIVFAIVLVWCVLWPIFEGVGLYGILNDIAIGSTILIIIGFIDTIKNNDGKGFLYWMVIAIEMIFIWRESSRSITVGCATTWPTFLDPFPMPISSSGDLCQFATSFHTPLFFIAVDILAITLLAGLAHAAFVMIRARRR